MAKCKIVVIRFSDKIVSWKKSSILIWLRYKYRDLTRISIEAA